MHQLHHTMVGVTCAPLNVVSYKLSADIAVTVADLLKYELDSVPMCGSSNFFTVIRDCGFVVLDACIRSWC